VLVEVTLLGIVPEPMALNFVRVVGLCLWKIWKIHCWREPTTRKSCSFRFAKAYAVLCMTTVSSLLYSKF